jgi:hypothetical protein
VTEPTYTRCHECNRGGNGNAVDKCACGWRVTDPCASGCFMGSPIEGPLRAPAKLSRSKNRYRRWFSAYDAFGVSFGEFMKREKEFEAIK